MTNNENVLYTSSNKSKLLRNTNRVSFSETINGSQSSPENEYETTTTSSLPPSSTSALKRTTPILFSTNRGLHLRVTSSANNNSLTKSRGGPNGTGGASGSSSVAASLSSSKCCAPTTSINSSYSITFCDLERWSTNRANTVSLEDTFTIARTPAVVPHSAVSGSLASNSLRFLPHNKSNSMRFKGYARFDME